MSFKVNVPRYLQWTTEVCDELCNGNASTDIEKYQRQSEDDRCLLVGTEGYGRPTY